MNSKESIDKQLNVELVKTEAPEADDIQLELLQPVVGTGKLETLSTETKSESANSNTFQSEVIGIWSEKLDKNRCHEELDIKNEYETIEEPLHNSGSHTSENPFKCNVCNCSYQQKSYLNIHLRSHTGENLFKCTNWYGSNDKRSLKRHLRRHTGEKSFKCKVCGNSFGHKSALKFHLSTHTGDKPFKCSVCDRSYQQKNDLDIHLRTHTIEKPFKCDACGNSFLLKNALKSHLRTHQREAS